MNIVAQICEYCASPERQWRADLVDLNPLPDAGHCRRCGIELETTTCCGQGDSCTPEEGEPLVSACQLCPHSPTYWRITKEQS